jgi:ABC-type hemin transport system ATPase subunit
MAIETAGLVKVFGENRAVDGIDLAVPAGTVYGVLGPNGAGKTTAVRQRVSLTGQYASVDEDLTGTENLVLLGRLLGHRKPVARERSARLSGEDSDREAAEQASRATTNGSAMTLLKIKHVPEQLFDVTAFPIMMRLMPTYLSGGDDHQIGGCRRGFVSAIQAVRGRPGRR